PIALPGTAPGNAATTLAKIGNALVQAINATAPDSFTTYLDGTTLVIANRSGAAFDASATVALQTPTSGSIVTAATGSAIVASLSGDPLAGEQWRLTLDATPPYVITVGSTLTLGGQPVVVDTREEIALAFASAVNLAGGDIVATAVGDAVVLVSKTGTAFTAQVQIELAVQPSVPAGSFAGSATVTQTGSVTATLSGTPQPGERWSIFKNGVEIAFVTYGSTVAGVGVVDTLPEFAAALAVNLNLLANYVAVGTSSPNAIAIVSTTGATLDDVSALVTRPGSAGTVGSVTPPTTPAAPVPDAKVLVLSGNPITGAVWSFNLDGSLVSVAAVAGDTAASMAAKIAAAINTDLTLNGPYGAFAAGEQVTIVKHNGGTPLALTALNISDGAALGGNVAIVFAPNNDTYTLLFAGVPVAGEVWTIQYDGATVNESLTVAAGMSLGDVVSGLAALVSAKPGYSAFVSNGTTLLVTKDGQPVATGPVVTVTAYNAIQQQWLRTVTLSGTPAVGDSWSVSIGADTASYTLVAADFVGDDAAAKAAFALTRIAAKLAASINDPNPAFASYSAVASGARIFISSMAGDFAPVGGATGTYTVTSAATQTVSTLTGGVAAGDTWTASLTDAAAGTVANFSYVAVTGDTLAKVATGLAAAINAGASGNFLATGKGSDLVLVNQAGIAFTTGLGLVPAAAMSVSRSFDVLGPVTPGDQWIVTLTAGGVETKVTVSVLSDLVGQVAALASAIDAKADYRAAAAGTTLKIATEGGAAGKSFTLALSAPSGSILEKTATTSRDLVLFGPAVLGDVWTVSLTTADGVTKTASATVVAALPLLTVLETLAKNLGDQINALTGYARLTSGSVIKVDTAGPNFGKNFSVALQIKRVADQTATAALATTLDVARGVPVPGEVWRVDLGIGASGIFNHPVAAGESLADVVAALAQSIGVTGIVAAARGESIAVLDTTGTRTATFSIPTVANKA
ncbi:MAG TPA: hypothetical protein VNR90_12740, partial [Vicinamibacterales bacterium]|nr:hypothetical protein [Vicinamibacterales bacterium]